MKEIKRGREQRGSKEKPYRPLSIKRKKKWKTLEKEE